MSDSGIHRSKCDSEQERMRQSECKRKREGRRGGIEYKTPMAKQRTKKKQQTKEGKVIKIMRRQWGRTGWCCAA